MASPRSPPAPKPATTKNIHYTAFIRLPFPRRDFVDPPLVDWDKSKEKALWKILSRAPRSADLDWKELASRFEVTLPFILQQAAAMYERQLSQMREQMRRASKQTKGQSSTGSIEKQPFTLAGGHPMQRQGSSDTTSRPRSLVETDSPLPSSLTATPRVGSAASREHPLTKRTAPPMSRNTSTNTITQSKPVPPSSPGQHYVSTVQSPLRRSPRADNATSPGRPGAGVGSDGQDSSSSSSDQSDENDSESEQTSSKMLTRSQMFRRTPRFMSTRKGVKSRPQMGIGNDSIANSDLDVDNIDEDEDEEEEAPAFLPLGGSEEQQPKQDMGATLRDQPRDGETNVAGGGGVTKIASRANTDSSISSASATSSAAPVASPVVAARGKRKTTEKFDSHRQAELAKLSPRKKAVGKDGSEGTLSMGSPSMGSSFSDLDDASVTQSALEEALNSNIQHGGGGSRMSNVSQALRSRHH